MNNIEIEALQESIGNLDADLREMGVEDPKEREDFIYLFMLLGRAAAYGS